MRNILTLIALVLGLTGYSTTITVTKPLGDDTLVIGQTANVTWTWTQNLPKVKIELYESNTTAGWRTLEDSIVNTGSYSFVVTPAPAYRQNSLIGGYIRVTKVDSVWVNGVSDFFYIAYPPLVANAGRDTTIACGGGLVQLGGNPSAEGALVPYTYLWTPSAGLSSSTIANPIATPTTTTTYMLTVIDSEGTEAKDTVVVSVTGLQINAGADISTCGAASVELNAIASPAQSGFGPLCTGSLTGDIGTDTLFHNQALNLRPSLFGNFAKSYRNQILYTAAELNSLLGGAKTIKRIDFQIVHYNSAAQVQNYRISIGHTNQDSLTNSFNDSLTTVCTIASQMPWSGWNGFPFDTGFVWDGVSNIIVEVCSYNPTTFGSQPNSVESSYTGSPSYCYAISNNDLCGINGSGTLSHIRPNIRLTYCDPAYVPYTYAWTPSVGLNNVNIANPIANPSTTTTYSVTVTDSNGCSASDTVNVSILGTLKVDTTYTVRAICQGGNTGSATVTLIGAQGPSNVTWSTGTSGLTAIGLAAGTYTFTASDAICSLTDSVTINDGEQVLADSAIITNACGSSANGAVCLYPTGTAPYNYTWSGGLPSLSCQTGLSTGTYNITVTDALSCTATAVAIVYASGGPQIDTAIVTNITCNGANDGSINLAMHNGTQNYTYQWSHLNTAEDAINLQAGRYYVSITDATGCQIIDSFDITEPPLLQAHLVSSTGGALPDTLSIIPTGGTTPYEYLASNFSTDSSIYIDLSGQGSCFWIQVTDSNGCQAVTDTFCYTCTDQCVWPGDANYDGVADNNDLLPIGLAYGNTGPARSQIDIGWYAHNGANWIDTLSNGANYKHIDCDGSGFIDAEDTLAIIQNYGFIHAKNEEDEPWRANAPELYVSLVPDTTRAGDTLYANIILGTTNISANSVYGLAFTVNYDALVVDSAKTRAIFGTSWLGTATDKISIAKDLPTIGKIKCAVTRIDHTTRSGNGQIGQVTFVITTDNINGKDFGYYNTRVWISDVLMMDNNGVELPVNAGRDSTLVEYEPLALNNIRLDDGNLKIQPNPAANAVQLSVTKDLLGAEIRLTDLSGRLLKSMPVIALNLIINTSELAGGIYLVQAISAKGTITKRLIIAR